MKKKSFESYQILMKFFFIIILSSQIIFSQTKQFPVEVKVHPMALKYFQLLGEDQLVDLIKEEFEKSFNKALNSYLNKRNDIKNINSNQSTQCIIEAMDKLVNDIQGFDIIIINRLPVPYFSKKAITLFFMFDNEFDNQFSLESLNVGNFNGDKDLHGGTDDNEKNDYLLY